jgi:hypothetical protein
MLLSSRLHQAFSLLSEVDSHSPLRELERLKTMLDDPAAANLNIPWHLAASRPPYINAIAKMPHQHTRSLRMVLLDTIHGFYLQALAQVVERSRGTPGA